MSDLTKTETIISAMRILANEIQSGDGVASAAILQAAKRLEKQLNEISCLTHQIELMRKVEQPNE